MNSYTGDPITIEGGEVIEDLLGFDALDLALLKSPDGRHCGDALRGLGALMRRVLELATQIGGDDSVDIRFMTEETARPQWRNATLANTAMLLVWSLIQQPRRRKGLTTATLNAARDSATEPVRISAAVRMMSIDELVGGLHKPPAADDYSHPVKSGVSEARTVSVAASARSLIGLDPARIGTRRGYDVATGPKRSIEADARLGMERLMRAALARFAVMRARDTTAIRLASWDDAADARFDGCPEAPSARACRIATLLAAALHNDERHPVHFLAPRVRSVRERAVLRNTAKLVYREYSEEAMKGLDLICDGIVHFGHGTGWSIAERLLFEVSRDADVDPGLRRMPHCVAAQFGNDPLLRAD